MPAARSRHQALHRGLCGDCGSTSNPRPTERRAARKPPDMPEVGRAVARTDHDRPRLAEGTEHAGSSARCRGGDPGPLPEKFTRQLYAQKCEAVYQHVFDSYWDDGHSVYDKAA